MELYAVITGDIKNFTKLADKEREILTNETEKFLASLVNRERDARIFRGDSYQLQLPFTDQILKKCIQLVCWFKMNSDKVHGVRLSTKLSIGISTIAYEKKSVLDSDGPAYHLSGRNYDQLSKNELIRLSTDNEEQNKLYRVILLYINLILNQWTISQAATIYQLLKNETITQEEIAKKLKMTQPAVAKSLQAARWKEVETGITYINEKLTQQFI